METTTEKKFLLQRSGYTLKSYQGDTSKRWYFSFYQVFSNGVKKRARVYGGINRHQEAAKRFEAARALLVKLEAGESFTFEAVAIHSLLSEYFEQKAVYLRTKSRFTYATKINTFIEYCSKKRVDSLERVNKAFCVGFLNSLKGSNVTINSYRNTLYTFFEMLVKDKRTNENPFAEIDKRAEMKVSKAPFSSAQMLLLKSAIENENGALWLACELQFYCFIRPGEIRLLRVEDFNQDDDFIKVPAAISKNKKSQIVSVPAVFAAKLKSWAAGLPQNYFIVNRSAQAVSRDFYSKLHKEYLKRLGFSARYSFYSWKHSGAVMAVKAGINLKDLQLQMRHHSLDQLNEYLRSMGVLDSEDLRAKFPAIG